MIVAVPQIEITFVSLPIHAINYRLPFPSSDTILEAVDDSTSNFTSSLIGSSATKYTAHVSTTYYNSKDTTVTKRPLNDRHTYCFSKFELSSEGNADSSATEQGLVEAFRRLKSSLMDEEDGLIKLQRKFTCRLMFTALISDHKVLWEGFIVEKGLTNNSIHLLTMLSPTQIDADQFPITIKQIPLGTNTRTELRKLWIDRKLSFDNRREVFRAKEFGISHWYKDVEEGDSVIVSMRRVPLFLSRSQPDSCGQIVAMITDHQNLGGWPGVQGSEIKDWSGQLSWWEAQPGSREAESYKDGGDVVGGSTMEMED